MSKLKMHSPDLTRANIGKLAELFPNCVVVSVDFVKLLAKREPLRVVFRDAGFATDSVKINVEQIFKLMSPSTEVQII